MKIKGKYVTIGSIKNCLVLEKARGKLNRTEISNYLEHDNMADGAYLQIHVKPYDEIDPSLFDDGDIAELYPMDNMFHCNAERLAPRVLLESGICPVCQQIKIEDDWDYCPVCGQRIKRCTE